ncbi:MAG: VWA domain-containing protein [Clostridia bacterium]|nr:VWA domain-containing protein [Clostridia bacterium]
MNCIKKALSLTLSLALAFAAFSGVIMTDLSTARAEGEDEESGVSADHPGVYLDKTAELQQDGTYTINLSAYSTGRVVSQVFTTEIPTDIVLVIDQSGSMEGQPLTDLKAALHSFADEIYNHSAANDVDHRVAMVGFANNYNTDTFLNTEIIIDGVEYHYNNRKQNLTPGDSGAAQTHYGEALMHVVDSHVAIEASIDKLHSKGGTHTNYGLEMAKGILDAYWEAGDHTYTDQNGNVHERKRVVLVFTDGTPGDQQSFDFTAEDTSEITVETLRLAREIKESGAIIYAVGLFEAEHVDEGDMVWTFMAALSSDYPHSYAVQKRERHFSLVFPFYYYTYSTEFTLGPQDDMEHKYFGFVQPHADGEEYNEHIGNIMDTFESISQGIINGEPNTTLDNDAIMKDVISDYFIIPDDFSVENNVTARTVNCIAIDENDGPGTYSYTFNEEEEATPVDSISIEGKTVSVYGFDYSADYCYKRDDTGVHGKKLEVEIRGLEAKPGVYGEQLLTNDPYLSGIYPNELADKPDPKLIFPKPTVDIPRLVYVYDFGMDIDFNYDALHDASAIDSLEFFDCYSKARPAPEQFTLSADGDLFGFGETPGDSQLRTIGAFVSRNAGGKTVYEWTRIDILPATTVFYEESFMNTVNGSFSGGLTADWEAVYDPANAGGSMQSYENFDYGYDSAYEGCYSDSHGSAYKVSVSNAMYSAMYGAGGSGRWPTATFTFTGTDVTVFGKVGLKMGTLAIAVVDSAGNTASTVLVDTYSRLELSQTPIYRLSEKMSSAYQPNCADTYTVTICPVYLPWLDRTKATPEDAIAAHEKALRDMLGWTGDTEIEFYSFGGGERGLRGSGSYELWVDGFRVYNPLGTEPGADAVSAYAAASEHPARYISIRSLINNGADGVSGSINGSVLYVECWDTPDGDSTVVGSVNIADYVDFGPEFEAYLAPHAAVEAGLAFTVDGWSKEDGTRLYISAKSLDGEAAELTVGGSDGTAIAIASGTEMFYDITDLVDGTTGTVLIRNTGSNRVALVDMKLIDPVDHTTINTTMNTLRCAEAMLYGTMGDADGDGEISLLDVVTAMRHALGADQLDAYGCYCADLNRDGVVDMLDVLLIMHAVLNC